jgi:hypothetical protein
VVTRAGVVQEGMLPVGSDGLVHQLGLLERGLRFLLAIQRRRPLSE